MRLSAKVQKVIAEEGISLSELTHMVDRAAITSKDQCNRRYHHWLFRVDTGDYEVGVEDMKLLHPVVVGVDRGLGTEEEPCDECVTGCKECGWRGIVLRYIWPTFKKSA